MTSQGLTSRLLLALTVKLGIRCVGKSVSQRGWLTREYYAGLFVWRSPGSFMIGGYLLGEPCSGQFCDFKLGFCATC